MAAETSIALIVKAQVDKAIQDLKKTEKELDKLNSTAASPKPRQEAKRQLGIIEKLQKSIRNLEARRARSNNPAKIRRYNQLLDKQRVKLIRLTKATDLNSKANKRNAATFAKLKLAVSGFIGVLILREVARFTNEIGLMGDALKQVQDPFDKLVRRAGIDSTIALEQLRKSVRGTASDLSLMQRSAQAMDAFTASGISADEAWKATTETLDFLFRFSVKFGKDFNQIMRTVFTGLQRGSVLFLDDVGIMIDQTDAMFKGLNPIEKKAKLVAVALEQMAQKSALLGEVQEGATLSQRQLSAEWSNFLAIVGSGVEGPLASFFGGLNDILQEFTKIPVSEKIEAERRALNSLVTTIIGINDKQGNRVRLLNELQKTYPDFIKNLNIETITNEKLAKQLQKTNKQLLNKIILQRAAEKRNEVLEAQADAYEAQFEATKSLGNSISELANEYDLEIDRTKSLSEQARGLIPLLAELNEKETFRGLAASSTARGMKELRTSIFTVISANEEYEKATKEVNVQTDEFTKLQKELGITLDDNAKKLKTTKPPKLPSADPEEKVLRTLQIENIEDPLQRQLAQIEAHFKEQQEKYKTNGLILAELEKQKNTAIEDAERAHQSILIKLRDENIADPFAKRLAQIDTALAEEQEKYKTNFAVLEELEKQAIANRKEVYGDYIDFPNEKDRERFELQKEKDQKKIEAIEDRSEFELAAAIVLAEQLLETKTLGAEAEEELIKLISDLKAEASDKDLQIACQKAAVLSKILAAPFADMTQSLLDGSAAGKDIFKDFLGNIRKQLASFMASQVFTIFSNFFFGLFGVSGSLLSGTIFKTGTKVLGSQTGNYVKGSSTGQPHIVGENNTDEIILPVNKAAAFLKGDYTLPGGFKVDNIPGLNISQFTAPTLHLPTFMAPANTDLNLGNIGTRPGVINTPVNVSLDAGELVNVMRDVRDEISVLQDEVRVLQNPRTIIEGEDIHEVYNKVDSRLIK